MKKVILLFIMASTALLLSSCGMMDMTNPEANVFDVVIVGDSIYDLDGFIHDHLEALSGRSYKDYSSSGDTIEYVAQQYEEAIDDNPDIRTIIMDAGGNDILMDLYWSQACQSSTLNVSSDCKAYINGVLAEVEDLWEDMDSDGVDDIVHTGYYYLKAGTLTTLLYGGTKLNGAVKYADEQLAVSTALSPASCYFIDPRAAFLGNESSYIKSDGIHPSDLGGEVMANLIWDTIVDNGIYQGEMPDDDDDSGCGG